MYMRVFCSILFTKLLFASKVDMKTFWDFNPVLNCKTRSLERWAQRMFMVSSRFSGPPIWGPKPPSGLLPPITLFPGFPPFEKYICDQLIHYILNNNLTKITIPCSEHTNAWNIERFNNLFEILYLVFTVSSPTSHKISWHPPFALVPPSRWKFSLPPSGPKLIPPHLPGGRMPCAGIGFEGFEKHNGFIELLW